MTDSLAVENTLDRHVRRTLLLAWPMILSRVGIVTMHTIDVIVLGRAGATELADYVLGQAVQDSLIAMVIGLLLGVPVLVARETGAGNDAAAGQIWRRGLGFALALGLALAALAAMVVYHWQLALVFAGLVGAGLVYFAVAVRPQARTRGLSALR